MIGRVIGNNRIEEQVGSGALGNVYRAAQLTSNQKVILWHLPLNLSQNAQFRNHFNQIANIASRLQHPHLNRVLETHVINNNIYFTTEYIGRSGLRAYLQARHRQGQALSVNECIEIAQQVSSALAYLHQSNLIYRHVQPDTILMRSANQPTQIVLENFILASLLDHAHGQQSVVASQLPYLSPEQLRRERIDIRSDVYSLGATFYEMLVGRPPFQGQTLDEALQWQLQGAVIPPSQLRPDIPQYIDSIVLKSLATNPGHRYTSGSDFYNVLSKLEGSAAQAVVPSVPPNLRSNYPSDASQQYARLVIGSGDAPPYTQNMDKPTYFIGRDEDNDLVFNSSLVSRQHARLDYVGDGNYQIMDLGSVNGVFLDTQRIPPNQPVPLPPGQVLQIGDRWLRLEIVPAYQGQAQAAPADSDPVQGRAQSPNRRFQVELIDNVLNLQGGTQSPISITITNLSDTTDTFGVEVQNIPRSWYTPPSDIPVGPRQKIITQIMFHPAALRIAQTVQFVTIIVHSRIQPGEAIAVNLPTTILAHSKQVIDVRIANREIRPSIAGQIFVTNNGTQPDTFTLNANARYGSAVVNLSPSQFTLQPGETREARVTVTDGSIGIPGFSPSKIIDVSLSSAQLPDSISETFKYNPAPIIPQWAMLTALGGIGILLVSMVFILIIGGLMAGSADNSRTPEPTSFTPEVTETVSATDSDNTATPTLTATLTTAPAQVLFTISADPVQGEAPLSVLFSSTVVSGDVQSYAWDFNGDGVVDSTAPSAQFLYQQNGTYNATLRVNTQSDNPPPPQIVTIIVRQTLAADFTAQPVSGTAPLIVNFTNASVPETNVSYAWDFNGDGTTDSTSKNPSFVYQQAGNYTVILTVSQPGGTPSTATATIFVQ